MLVEDNNHIAHRIPCRLRGELSAQIHSDLQRCLIQHQVEAKGPATVVSKNLPSLVLCPATMGLYHQITSLPGLQLLVVLNKTDLQCSMGKDLPCLRCHNSSHSRNTSLKPRTSSNRLTAKNKG